jgi:prepilin signal peptidase PulO-like enzyme (type II secretory pathway)
MDPVPASQSAGQISADGQFRWDGQQWVPLAAGFRQPTPWTRPMQLAAAGVLAVSAVVGVITTLIFYNHDAVVRALHAQGTTIPAGTTEDTVVNITIGFAIAFAIGIGIVELVGAIGSYLGWRWVFWPVLVICGLTAIGALLGLFSFARTSSSPIGAGGLVISELLDLLGAAVFVWMLVGLIKYGPWAMKRPGT